MKLYIDSTDNMKTLIRLDDKEFIKENATPREQDVLGFITETIQLQGRTLKDISMVEVNTGPGSFTGTRVGVAIGNALAFALRIKVNGQEPPITPIYSEGPHITTPKVPYKA